MKKELTFKEIINITDMLFDGERRYGFATTMNILKKFEQIVLNSRNLNWIYMFAERYSFKNENVRKYGAKYSIKNSVIDINAFSNFILAYGNNDLNFRFAGIPGANFKAHENFILKKGSIYYNYNFIKCYKNADVQAHKNVLIKKYNSIFSTKKQKEKAKHYLDLLEKNVKEGDKFFEMEN